MTTQTSVQSAPCPRCRSTQDPVVEQHQGGATIICRTCGHSQETDRHGRLYTPPASEECHSTTHDTVHYPTGLACTTVYLLRHNDAVRTPGGYITAGRTSSIAFRVYHQPYRRPVMTFRAVKSRATDAGVRYIYAAEMLPFDEAVIMPGSRDSRALRNLLLQEASVTSGFNIQATNPNWPICPPGTILRAPLAPYQ